MSIKKYIWVFLLSVNGVFAQNLNMQNTPSLDFGEDNQQLEQKYKMATYLLNKSSLNEQKTSPENTEAITLYNTAKENYQVVIQNVSDQKWLEANALIDWVLRDLTASSRILSQKNINKNLYIENLKRVESFVFPNWGNLNDKDQNILDQANLEIEELVSRANVKAIDNQFEDANALLYKAYNQKTQLLQKLDHESTIVYDLIFDTPEDEYKYMVKRNKHYQEMVDKVISENKYDEQTMKLVSTYINRGRSSLGTAYESQKNNAHKDAIRILELSIKDFSTALKLLGIKF